MSRRIRIDTMLKGGFRFLSNADEENEPDRRINSWTIDEARLYNSGYQIKDHEDESDMEQ